VLARGLALPVTLALVACASGPAGSSGVASYPPTSTSSASAGSSPGEAEASDPTTARTFGWLGIGVGAEGAILAAVTSVAMLDYKSARDSGCNAQKLCSTAGLNADNQISGLAGWNAGAWVLAVAGLGGGTILLLTHPPEQRQRAPVTLTPGPTGAGLGLSGSF
jgi:hypothetical protein